jgi:hypothetical protein
MIVALIHDESVLDLHGSDGRRTAIPEGEGAALGRVLMVHTPDFAKGRLAKRFVKPGLATGEPLPIGTAMLIITGVSAVLWSLIALAIASVI